MPRHNELMSDSPAQLSRAFTQIGSYSFMDFLQSAQPQLLEERFSMSVDSAADRIPHGTTIVAATCAGGVVIAGDRRATVGHMIAKRDMQKVFPVDSHTCVGIAGSAGTAVQMTKIFRLELEHYEKLAGSQLSLEGKANRLGTLVNGNFGAAMQGLTVIPLLAGYDVKADADAPGKIFSYDITGGKYEEYDYDSIGSGSMFAKGALKKRFRAGMTIDEAATMLVDSLYDAADDDAGTGGPDAVRKIYPLAYAITADGVRQIDEEAIVSITENIIEQRKSNPGG